MRKPPVKKNDSRPIIYCGLDLSLTGTGVCIIDRQGTPIFTKTLKIKTKGMERLFNIRTAIQDILNEGTVWVAVPDKPSVSENLGV